MKFDIKELLDTAASLPNLLEKVKEAALEALPESEKFKVNDVLSSIKGKSPQEIEEIREAFKNKHNAK